jgi:hypothetical protein
MDEISILKTRIADLKKQIDDNPQYSQNIVDSILDDINYYENQLDYLLDT